MQMQDMIKKIIDMDKDARRLTDEARQRRADSTQSSQIKRQEVFDGYLLMARNRVETIRKVETLSAQEQNGTIDKRSADAEERMRTRFDENREHWVEQIFSAITKGEGSR